MFSTRKLPRFFVSISVLWDVWTSFSTYGGKLRSGITAVHWHNMMRTDISEMPPDGNSLRSKESHINKICLRYICCNVQFCYGRDIWMIRPSWNSLHFNMTRLYTRWTSLYLSDNSTLRLGRILRGNDQQNIMWAWLSSYFISGRIAFKALSWPA
jgi:hypothetical protein